MSQIYADSVTFVTLRNSCRPRRTLLPTADGDLRAIPQVGQRQARNECSQAEAAGGGGGEMWSGSQAATCSLPTCYLQSDRRLPVKV
jgi:hypothetical protein